MTAEARGWEEQALEGTILAGRFSTDRRTVVGRLAFWTAVSHFFPRGRVLSLFQELEPM